MAPELPALDVPLLITTTPETPADPTFELVTTTDPDPPLTLDPLVTVTTPPTPPLIELEPADSSIAPEVDPESVLPTMMLMAPP